MQTKEKLIKIINTTTKGVLNEHFQGKLADAIIENGLIKDDSVYAVDEQEITIRQAVCPKCGYFVGASYDSVLYSYCPGCGVKIRSDRSNNNASNS